MAESQNIMRMRGEITFAWSEQLEARLRRLLKDFRQHPRAGNTSTPELLLRAARQEKRLENELLKAVVVALADNAPASIDLGLIDACERLQDRVAAAPTEWPAL